MEEPVQQHRLKRELRLADLVLMQVLLIFGLSWVGTIGVEGSTHVFLWLAGIVFFYLPLGAVVIALSRAIPFEGGAYQWVKAGFGDTGLGELIVIVTVCVPVLQNFAAWVALVGMTARFPMVIGWDGLLPDWWSDLHPRFRTPVKALAMVTAASIAVALVNSSGGATGQEIIRIGTGGAIACLCIYYALLFAVVAFGKFPVPLRLAALCGFLVSAAALPFQIVPIIGVTDRVVFAMKVGGLICAINAVGAWLYWRGAKRLKASQHLLNVR
jgi:amino acid transporter